MAVNDHVIIIIPGFRTFLFDHMRSRDARWSQPQGTKRAHHRANVPLHKVGA
jgi:hypothetical protein